MYLPRLLRPVPALGAVPSLGPPGRSPVTLLSAREGSFVGEILARWITDEGRWDRCAWLREPPREPCAARRAIVEAVELRRAGGGPGDGRVGEPRPTGVLPAFEAFGRGSVLVVELTRRCARGMGRFLADVGLQAEQTGTEVVIASDAPPSRCLRRAIGDAFAFEMASVTASQADAIGLDEELAARLRRLTRGREAALHDLAMAGRPAEPIEAAVRASHTGRGFVGRVTAMLLEECSDEEREALQMALRANYWHPQFSAGSVSSDALRPWITPLEHDWGWVRPVWRPALERQLAKPPGERRTRRAPPGAPAPVDVVWRSELDVRVLGDFEMRVDGQPIAGIDSRLGSSILRYLATRPGRTCPRDVLIEAFWPDVDPERARNRLQVAISALRRSVRRTTELEIIEHVGGWYRINPDLALTVDVVEFEHFADLGRRAEAVDDVSGALDADLRAVHLYRGDLCPDLPFEEWTIFVRERARLRFGDVLDRLARNQWRIGDLTGCLATGERMLEQDPCREDAHRLLMQCYAALGRPHQAARQFDACRRVLKAQLAANPSPATLTTYREIRRQEQSGGR